MSDPGTWKSWEGRSADGKFPLRQWLGGSQHSAVFLTERPGQSGKAAIKLIAADPATADQQLSRWRVAAQLSNPHLMRLYECGRCQFDNTALLYVVMEFAEEDLSQILPQRPLVPAEVTDLLPPLLDALSFLHGKGFVHGRVMPSNVLATGDLLKLSADQITSSSETNPERKRRDVYDAPETAAGIVSPAGDVWSVGVTLVAALTQNVSFDGESSQADPTLPQTLPQPFRGIARECLHLDPKRRCSLADIQARLQPAARSVPAETETSVPAQRPVKRGPIAAALLVAAVLIGAIIFFARGRNVSVPAPAPETTTAPAPKTEAPVSPPPEPPRKPTSSRGDVVHQVLPEVSPSARNTINGTIKVTVHVDVDPSGKVVGAKFKSAGPSKYFAGLAMKAAEQWQFSPPEVDGNPTTSAWLLQFRFKRGSTQVTPERVTR